MGVNSRPAAIHHCALSTQCRLCRAGGCRRGRGPGRRWWGSHAPRDATAGRTQPTSHWDGGSFCVWHPTGACTPAQVCGLRTSDGVGHTGRRSYPQTETPWETGEAETLEGDGGGRKGKETWDGPESTKPRGGREGCRRGCGRKRGRRGRAQGSQAGGSSHPLCARGQTPLPALGHTHPCTPECPQCPSLQPWPCSGKGGTGLGGPPEGCLLSGTPCPLLTPSVQGRGLPNGGSPLPVPSSSFQPHPDPSCALGTLPLCRAVDTPDPGAGWRVYGAQQLRRARAAATHCHPYTLFSPRGAEGVVREKKVRGLLECAEGTSRLTERICKFPQLGESLSPREAHFRRWWGGDLERQRWLKLTGPWESLWASPSWLAEPREAEGLA